MAYECWNDPGCPTLLKQRPPADWMASGSALQAVAERVVAQAPEQPCGWRMRGDAYQKAGDYSEAALSHERAAALAPDEKSRFDSEASVFLLDAKASATAKAGGTGGDGGDGGAVGGGDGAVGGDGGAVSTSSVRSGEGSGESSAERGGEGGGEGDVVSASSAAPTSEADGEPLVGQQLVGKSVMVVGVVSKPELNGQSGLVESVDESRGRCRVVVDSKPYNLRPAQLRVSQTADPLELEAAPPASSSELPPGELCRRAQQECERLMASDLQTRNVRMHAQKGAIVAQVFHLAELRKTACVPILPQPIPRTTTPRTASSPHRSSALPHLLPRLLPMRPSSTPPPTANSTLPDGHAPC
jgi:hypothetical protein